MADEYERTDDQIADSGVDLDADDPLPDIPDAGDDSVPITSSNPLDFSTAGIAGAGAAGMSTFNDDDDRTLFERTADVFEEAGIDPPLLGDADTEAAPGRDARTDEQ